MKGYKVVGRHIKVDSRLTENQFRLIEKILNVPPEKFKSWSESFHFNVLKPRRANRLLKFLRDSKLPHEHEITYRWSS